MNKKNEQDHNLSSTVRGVESMIHVVFQQSDVTTLQKLIALDETLKGDIFEIKDEFAVGPLDNLDTDEGWSAREKWWTELIEFSPYPNDLASTCNDRETVKEIKKKMDRVAGLELWIWMGQNQHDVCGYYWLVSQLKDYQGRVSILHLNNLPFINEKGQLFYPNSLHEISPKELVKAKKLARKITPGEFEVDPDEWKKLCNNNAMVRLLEAGKKIVSVSVDYYDDDIIKNLTDGWQKGNRAIHNILTNMKIKTGDVFLLWRMKHLAEVGKIEITGDPSKGWKEFEVRLKSSSDQEISVNVENENVNPT
ncbi:MAG: DUF1835 domain-containing protein [Chitinophagaceae bacterium]